jgi:hypothetical protein
MAITAFILNFYMTRKRKLYYFVAIGVSWIAFVLWEVYELVAVATGLGVDISRLNLWILQ